MKDLLAELRAQRPPVVEVISEEVARVWAAKSGSERLASAFEMAETARRLLRDYLRNEHPDWDEAAVDQELARRWSYEPA